MMEWLTMRSGARPLSERQWKNLHMRLCERVQAAFTEVLGKRAKRTSDAVICSEESGFVLLSALTEVTANIIASYPDRVDVFRQYIEELGKQVDETPQGGGNVSLH